MLPISDQKLTVPWDTFMIIKNLKEVEAVRFVEKKLAANVIYVRSKPMIQCDYCGTEFDPVARRWLCPCGMKNSCCEGEPQEVCSVIEEAQSD